jgi:hypothetical protein
MSRFSNKDVLLSIIVIFSISLISIPINSYAEEIFVSSVGVDKTTIITVTNDSKQDVETFRIWLTEEFDFEAFKTEQGWIGEKNPQGVIIFTSTDSIKVGESVKFGIKTDKPNPIINWKGLDQENNTISVGAMIPTEISTTKQNPEINVNENIINTDGGIFSESIFRIIPDKPNVGSTIRITGEAFGTSQIFDFYIDTKKIGSFETDQDGFFITTMKIPNDEIKERVDFKIKNKQGDEKVISLRLGTADNRIVESEKMKLSISGIDNIVKTGDKLDISGTGIPGTTIITKIITPEDNVLYTRTAKVDGAGLWKLSEPIDIPFDSVFGKYSITVSDGDNELLKNWTVETNKIIVINPTEEIVEEGELMKFIGTAMPNEKLELVLESNLGKELKSEIINVGNSGFIEFEYQTKENDDPEGTWTLIATQGATKEFTYVGYGVIPTIPVNLKFDKVNYNSSDTAVISLLGTPLVNVKMIIINPAGTPGDNIFVQLQGDGRATYELDLTGYGSGIYTAVTKIENSQSSEQFSVGLQIGSGPINATITQTEYQLGEPILLIGETNPNSLLTAKLTDPSGEEIKRIEIPTDNEGSFSESGFRIPENGISGSWKITISSGSNLEIVDFEVFIIKDDGMIVEISDGAEIPGYGKTMKIEIQTTHKSGIVLQIVNQNGVIIEDSLNCNTTAEFNCETYWTIPKDMLPGTYTLIADDNRNKTETQFIVE